MTLTEREIERVAQAIAAQQRAQNAKAQRVRGDPPNPRTGYRGDTRAVASDDALYRSGWGVMGQEETGYRRIFAQEIKTYSELIGHALDVDADVDQLNTGGWPGIADATHAEKQAAIGSPDQPIGVNYLMCDSCQDFFSKHAIYMRRIQYVADPKVTRIFYPDGTGRVVSRFGAITSWVNFYVA